ncbi:MAG: DUF1736 domain-containing protein [Verrucomicrobiae bacterium]|nr:DUF1736 domain-containing protein [Verrucomicrobiae bacterium]
MQTPQPLKSVLVQSAGSTTEGASRRGTLWTPRGLRCHLAATAALAVVVLLGFANTLRNTEFALDNKFIILEDPRLREAKWENIKLIFTEDYWYPKAVSGLYRPLTTLSYLFNYAVLGSADKALSYHVVNLLLHGLNAVLVYFLVMLLLDNPWPAFFAAALFSLHPIVTESVTNIVGRADLFAMAAVLGAFLAYAKSAVCSGWRRLLWLSLVAAISTTGVFCKESAIAVLPVMVLYDFTWRLHLLAKNWAANLLANGWEFFLKGYIAVLPAITAMCVVRNIVFGRLRPPEQPFVDNPLVDLGFWEARLTAIKVLGKYFWLLVWPARLSCDYSYNQIPLVQFPLNSWEDWKSVAVLVLVLFIIAVAILSYRRQKAIFFYIGFFFLTFLPSSNLIPNPTFGESLWDKRAWCIGSIMAERFLYLPSVAYAGLTVIAVYTICRKLATAMNVSARAKQIWFVVSARGLLITLAVAYGIRTFIRNYDWDNDVRLWTSAVEVCPNSFKSYKSLAFALYEKDPQGRNIDRIIQIAEKAAQITDRAQIVFLHLGAYYRIKGDLLARRTSDGSFIPTPESVPFYRKSIEALQKAVPLDRAFNDENRAKELRRGRKPEDIPDIGNYEIYWNLGHSYMRLGLLKEARAAYLYMRHLSPANPDAYVSLASVAIAENKLEEAAVCLLQALLLDNTRKDALRTIVSIYSRIDREGTAVIFGSDPHSQPRLNPNNTLVKNHICAACLGLVETFIASKQYELAQSTRLGAINVYQCPPAAFDRLIATIPPSKRTNPDRITPAQR